MSEMGEVRPQAQAPGIVEHEPYPEECYDFTGEPVEELFGIYDRIRQVDKNETDITYQQERDSELQYFDRSIAHLFDVRPKEGVAAIAAFGATDDPEKQYLAVRHLGTMVQHDTEAAVGLWKRLLHPDSEVRPLAQEAVEKAQEAGVLTVAQVVDLQAYAESGGDSPKH
jgi:hypothetical protein